MNQQKKWKINLLSAVSAVLLLFFTTTTQTTYGETAVPLILIVNSTADPGDGSCDTTECTLREAITLANDTAGNDTITFNIPGNGPHTIQPTSALPTIVEGVVIDGYTQPGAHPNTNPLTAGSNAVLMIELDGSQAGISDGLFIWSESGSITLRGLVINRFTGFAIGSPYLEGTPQVGHIIAGNFIGTDVTGHVALGNGTGIQLTGFAWQGITIGGTDPAARNLISGNHDVGLGIYSRYHGEHVVQGNYIGTDVTGQSALPNGNGGVFLNGYDTTVGGSEPEMANVISGNGGFGIRVDDNDSSNRVEGNWIGLDATGTWPLGNLGNGIQVDEGVLRIYDNTIAFNGGDGITIAGDFVREMPGNTIFANGGLGIDINNDGITPNDGNDADWLPNFPLLSAVYTNAGHTTIEGVLNSQPDYLFTLQFFANATCDPSGHGEGEQWLGDLAVTTGSDGYASFTATLATAVPVGYAVTATATSWGTSEFSACQPVVALPDTTPPVCAWVDTVGPVGHVTLQDAQSGLATIQVVQSRNVFVTIPSFTPGTNNLIDVTLQLINPSRPGQVRLITSDIAGNRALCNGQIRP